MGTAAPKRRLGDIFVERGLVTQAQLEEALAEQKENGGKLGEILVEKGYVTRVALAGVISAQWDDIGFTASARKAQEVTARTEAAAATSIVETALRQRVDALTAELAVRDEKLARQSATIDALLARIQDLESGLRAPAA